MQTTEEWGSRKKISRRGERTQENKSRAVKREERKVREELEAEGRGVRRQGRKDSRRRVQTQVIE